MANDLRSSGRIWIIVSLLAVAALIVTVRLFIFQVVQGDKMRAEAAPLFDGSRTVQPPRGTIRDRHGNVLAAPGNDYAIGVSPPYVYDATRLATDLAPILLRPRTEILEAIDVDAPYVLLEGRVSAEIALEVENLSQYGVQLDPLQRRIYPQGELMCHVLGYVDYDNNGGSGVEAYYQAELAGLAAFESLVYNPAVPRVYQEAERGVDLVLTIDATVQRIVEQHLKDALKEYDAQSGTIIAMDPRTGAILAMASDPCYDPQAFYATPYELFINPAVSQQYEPGSVMKLVTMASAIDSGTVAPSTTYVDNGVFIIGESEIYNSDFSGPGVTDMTTLLRRSLNVGSATIATWMGAEQFYSYYQRFGFGQTTGIDLMGESSGTMLMPGHPLWTPVDVATNSFGQGMAVTPLQMISAVSAIANQGDQMLPHVVAEFHSADGVVYREPEIISTPIEPRTADQVTTMAIQSVSAGAVPGYTVAGKTGTAQIVEGGVYHPTDTIASYIGWLPADDPQLIMLVKLDRPQESPWGSRTAAPTFAKLASELVVLLDIPPDEIRLGTTSVQASNN